MTRVFLTAMLLAAAAAGQQAGLLESQTNRYVVSQEVEKRQWRRTAVMASPEGRPLDPSGQLAAYSDAAALAVTAARAGEIGDAASAAISNAVQSLAAVTNLIPASAQHFALSLPGLRQPNLQAMVEEEGTDGSNDWQMVRFNQYLSAPPKRSIRYVYAGGTSAVESVWTGAWDTNSLTHRCSFRRPALIGERYVVRTRTRDVFGGAAGMSFGSALVTVDGIPTFTGSVTNDLTGEILIFNNGVLTK